MDLVLPAGQDCVSPVLRVVLCEHTSEAAAHPTDGSIGCAVLSRTHYGDGVPAGVRRRLSW
ncbi:hypothetical protein D8W71_19065 [Rhodococcus sp. P1Y]|nr:hypothetical protein D8W71_19065 [Rhodococcus sp. P1Y]